MENSTMLHSLAINDITEEFEVGQVVIYQGQQVAVVVGKLGNKKTTYRIRFNGGREIYVSSLSLNKVSKN